MSNVKYILFIGLIMSAYCLFLQIKKIGCLDTKSDRDAYEQSSITMNFLIKIGMTTGGLCGCVYGLFCNMNIKSIEIICYVVTLSLIMTIIPICTYKEFINSNPSFVDKIKYYGGIVLYVFVFWSGYYFLIQ